MIKNWVNDDLLEMTWDLLETQSWGPDIVMQLVESDVVSKDLEVVGDREVAKEMMEDARVGIEMEGVMEEGTTNTAKAGMRRVARKSIGKVKAAPKKPTRKMLLAMVAEGCSKMTGWVKRMAPVDPLLERRLCQAEKKKDDWKARHMMEGNPMEGRMTGQILMVWCR